MMKRENVEKDLRQHFPKKSLMVFVDANTSSQDESHTNEDLSGEILEMGNKMLRMQSSTDNRNKRSKRTPILTKPRHINVERIKQKEEEEEREHQRKVKEIIKHVSVHYQSNIYFTYEARRIVQTGIVKDELRKMAEDVEKVKYGGLLRNKAVQCGKPDPIPPKFVWPKPSGAVIHVVKDALNDGV